MFRSSLLHAISAIAVAGCQHGEQLPSASIDYHVPEAQSDAFLADIKSFATAEQLELTGGSYRENPLGFRFIQLERVGVSIAIRNPSDRDEYRVAFYDEGPDGHAERIRLVASFEDRFSIYTKR